MAAGSFPQALKFVLVDEGGNDDDPADHGGRTSRGITQREYDAWNRLHNSPSGDVWRASDETIAAIYHQQYWLPYSDGMQPGLDYLFFDMNVNAGLGGATRQWQRALGVSVDGHFGVVTAAATKDINGVPEFIEKVSDVRRAFYRGLHQQRFLRGWLNRVQHAHDNALKFVEA